MQESHASPHGSCLLLLSAGSGPGSPPELGQRGKCQLTALLCFRGEKKSNTIPSHLLWWPHLTSQCLSLPGSGMVKPCKRLGDPGTWRRKVRIKTGGATGSQTPPPPLSPALAFPFLSTLSSACDHSAPPRSPFSALLVLFSFSPRPRMLQPPLPLPGHPPLLPCLPCSVQGLRQTVPNSFFLSLSFLSPGESPLFWAQTTVRLSKAWDGGLLP